MRKVFLLAVASLAFFLSGPAHGEQSGEMEFEPKVDMPLKLINLRKMLGQETLIKHKLHVCGNYFAISYDEKGELVNFIVLATIIHADGQLVRKFMTGNTRAGLMEVVFTGAGSTPTITMEKVSGKLRNTLRISNEEFEESPCLNLKDKGESK